MFCINTDNSDEAETKPFAWRSHFQDQAIAEMAIAARDEQDAARRIEAYVALQKHYMQNSPFVLMMQGSTTAACRPDVSNVRIGVLPSSHSYAAATKA